MVRLLIHYCLIFDMKCNSTYISFHCNQKNKKNQVMKFEEKKLLILFFKNT